MIKLKLFLLVFLILNVVSNAYSSEMEQKKEVSEVERHVTFQYGPALNLRMATIGSYEAGNSSLNSMLGFGIGAGFYGRLLFSPKWFMTSSVNFNYDAMHEVLNGNAYSDLMTEWEKYDFDSFSMEIPLHFGYRFPMSQEMHFNVYLGVSGTFLLAGNISGPSDSRHFDAYGTDGILRRSSMNGDFGACLELDNYALIDIGGKLGFLNMAKKNVFGFNKMFYCNTTISLVFFL